MKKFILLLTLAFSLQPSAFAGTNASVMFNTNTGALSVPTASQFYLNNPPPGGSGSSTNAQAVARGVSSWIAGMQSLGQWNNLIVADWFSPGQSYISPSQSNGMNIVGIVPNAIPTNPATGFFLNAGLALNCVQTNSGLYLNGTNSAIVFSNIFQQNGPVALMVFFTPQGWNNPLIVSNNQYVPGGFFGLTNGTGEILFTVSGGGDTVGAYPTAAGATSTANVSCNSPGLQSSQPSCMVLTTDRTNLAYYEWEALGDGCPSSWLSSTTNMTNFTGILNQLVIGAKGLSGGTNYNYSMQGVVSGFIAISNYLSLAQAQQIFYLAANTVLPWRRVILEGDSLALGLYESQSVTTNNFFWGNCAHTCTAISGTSIEEIVNRFYPALATNMPNGLDNIYPSTVIFWGGQNSLGSDTAPQIESNIFWEISQVHALGGRIYLTTPTESLSASTNSTAEARRVALKAWELSGASGADGVADCDTMFYQLLGTNYYTNLTYFDGTVHCTALGYSLVATNFAGVIGSNILTTNNLFVGCPLQPALDTVPPGSTGAPTATSNTLGVVRPDNSTVTINNGVLSATGGGGSSSNSVTTNCPLVDGTPATFVFSTGFGVNPSYVSPVLHCRTNDAVAAGAEISALNINAVSLNNTLSIPNNSSGCNDCAGNDIFETQWAYLAGAISASSSPVFAYATTTSNITLYYSGASLNGVPWLGASIFTSATRFYFLAYYHK
jgi:hypothetical protein